MSGSNPNMKTTFVRLIDYEAKRRAKASLFNFPNISKILKPHQILHNLIHVESKNNEDRRS